MITNLYVKNIALIKELELELGEGLNVLTGETGAGKSIIIDSLNFVLGDRADRSLISHGEVSASVSVTFWDKKGAAKQVLEEYGIESDESITVRRTMHENGRGEARVNNIPVTVQQLRKLMARLVSVHSQHESQRALDENSHLEILDKFRAKGSQDRLLSAYKNAFSLFKSASERLRSFGNAAERERRAEMLRYEIEEINAVDPKPGEEEELLSRRMKARNSERIVSGIQAALTLLEGSDESFGALSAVRYALRELGAMERFADFSEYSERLESVSTEIDDLARALRAEADSVDMDPEEAEQVDKRLEDVRRIKRRYGASEELPAYLKKASDELNELENAEETIRELTKTREEALEQCRDLSAKLHAAREEAGKEFAAKITENLRELGMKNAEFKADVVFSECGENGAGLAENGSDTVRFLISPNLGEPLKPLAKIASGGEASRFMLGLKRVTAELEEIDSLVFDEIDTGISGKIAMVVSEKLVDISRSRQVVAVTHLAQLGAMADIHFLIEKHEKDGRTFTEISRLDRDGELKELVRLMGGVGPDKLSTENAKELKKWADSYKSNIK